MRYLFRNLITFAIILSPSLSYANIEDIKVDDLITQIKQIKKMPEAARLNGERGKPGICQVINNTLNVERMAGKAAGKFYKTANKKERSSYVRVFVTHLARMTAEFLKDLKLEDEGHSLTKKGTRFSYYFPSIDTSFDIVSRKAKDTKLVLDVRMKGMSFLKQLRSQYTQLGRQGGLVKITAGIDQANKRSKVGLCEHI